MAKLRSRLIRLRPRMDTLYVSQSRAVLATDLDGFISNGAEHGLFVHQTRLLCRYRYTINGEPLQPVALSNVEEHSWLGYYITLAPGVETDAPDEGSGQLDQATQQTLELRLSRTVGAGIHEDVDLTNYTQQSISFQLELEVDADFADQIETKGERKQQGEIKREWRAAKAGSWELAFDYKVAHEYEHQGNAGTARLHRGVTLRIADAPSPPSYSAGRISFPINLAPHQTWHACVNIVPFIDGQTMEPMYGCHAFEGVQNEYDERRENFLSGATRFTAPQSETLTSVAVGALEQARRDLAALRLHDLNTGEQAWTMAAGLPIYVALFGRDTLTAAWQAALLSPEMLRGTLPALARLQGATQNDWRDEQPGRMVHEAHTGPLEVLNFNPRARYYGSITTSSFYPVVLSALWHWTGDRDVVRPLVASAMKALKWLDDYADFNGQGFYAYRTRSEQGTKHQAWKDSPDAIVDQDGLQIEAPVATCEEQGFAYLAKLQMSELLWWLDEKTEAKRLYGEAGELKKRFNETFWMAEAGFFAMGLDAHGRQIKSIGSNPGHCLATAIADEAHVERVADRLLAPDLFSGWGIRTLSSDNPAYNPYSYHRGSIWTVEHGTFALAFMRYGLHRHAERITRAQFEAAAHFDFYRLPEAFSGHTRDAEHPFPALYPQANSPQAWSASATFSMLQALLGLYPYAPLKMLLVDPQLPQWLPEITLNNLRVGEATATIRFYREGDGRSSYEVLDQQGALHILRQPSPWSLTAGYGERLMDALTSLLPG